MNSKLLAVAEHTTGHFHEGLIFLVAFGKFGVVFQARYQGVVVKSKYKFGILDLGQHEDETATR